MAFYTANQYDSALAYYYEAIRLGRETQQKPILASSLNSIGVIYSKTGFLDSSVVYYSQALELFNSLYDTAQANQVEANLAIIYKDLGLYEKALENSFNLLSKLERGKPGRELASCANTMGLVYSKIGDFESALEYLRKSLEVRKAIGYDRGVGQSYNSIAEVYMGLHQYDSALANLQRSLAIKRRLGERAALSSTLNNIGDVLLRLNRITEAEPYFLESLALKKEFKDRIGQGITLNNLGRVKLAQNQIAAAEEYLRAAYSLIRETQSLEDMRVNLQLKIELYKAQKDWDRALMYAEELIVVKDSLLTGEKARAMRSLQLRYETEKKEQQIAFLEQQDLYNQARIASNKFQIQALVFGSVFLVIIVAILYRQNRIIKKNKARIELLMKEVHHRVKNNLQILSNILSLQYNYLTDDTAIQTVRSNESRINAMALIHKKLYVEDQESSINIKEYVTELLQYLVHAYGYYEKNIRLDLRIADLQLDVDKAIPIGLILNELISNAFKHAFPGNELPELFVELRRESDKILIRIEDNGAGLDKRSATGKAGFGIKMVNMLIRDMKGSYEVDNTTGTKYNLTIPLS